MFQGTLQGTDLTSHKRKGSHSYLTRKVSSPIWKGYTIIGQTIRIYSFGWKKMVSISVLGSVNSSLIPCTDSGESGICPGFERTVVIIQHNQMTYESILETEEEDSHLWGKWDRRRLESFKLSSNELASQSPTPTPQKKEEKSKPQTRAMFLSQDNNEIFTWKEQNVHGFKNKNPYILDSLVICQT